MNLRLAGLTLWFAASGVAFANAEHDRIASERSEANARLSSQERDCATRFIVADCVEDARKAHRLTLKALREQELALDEARRQAAAQTRLAAIAEKAQAQQARASDPTTEPPRIRVRRGSQAAESTGRPDEATGSRREKASGSGLRADRAATERRNLEKFELRQRQAEARREAVARRNEERARAGKVAPPLPVPQGASAAR